MANIDTLLFWKCTQIRLFTNYVFHNQNCFVNVRIYTRSRTTYYKSGSENVFQHPMANVDTPLFCQCTHKYLITNYMLQKRKWKRFLTSYGKQWHALILKMYANIGTRTTYYKSRSGKSFSSSPELLLASRHKEEMANIYTINALMLYATKDGSWDTTGGF